MAKNYNPNNLDQRQAEIRKAKGNPNKNIHHKKKMESINIHHMNLFLDKILMFQ